MAAAERRKKKINLEIGLRLREIRETLGYSQYDFGKVLHVSLDHYRKIENGTSSITMDKFQILYDRFRIEPAYLITGKRNQEVDMEYLLETCGKPEKDRVIGRFADYMIRLVERGRTQ